MELIRNRVNSSEDTDELIELYCDVLTLQKKLKTHELELNSDCDDIRHMITTRLDYIMTNQ